MNIDFILIANLMMLIGNIIALVIIQTQTELKYKEVRLVLLITVTFGILANFGKITWLTVIFALAPWVMLFKKRKSYKDHNIV